MRTKDDCTWAEYKECMDSHFHLVKDDGWTPAEVVDAMLHIDEDYIQTETSLAIWMVTCALSEVKLGILEQRVQIQASAYIPMFESGYFDKDLYDGEKEEIMEDIKYIKEHMEILDVCKREDNE